VTTHGTTLSRWSDENRRDAEPVDEMPGATLRRYHWSTGAPLRRSGSMAGATLRRTGFEPS
jgi:hypothetical protein